MEAVWIVNGRFSNLRQLLKISDLSHLGAGVERKRPGLYFYPEEFARVGAAPSSCHTAYIVAKRPVRAQSGNFQANLEPFRLSAAF